MNGHALFLRRLLAVALFAALFALPSRAEDALELLRDRESSPRANTLSVNYTQIRFEKVLADLERNSPGLNVKLKADTFAEEQALLAAPVTLGPLAGVSFDAALKYIADRLGLVVDRSQIAEGVVYLEKVARFTDSFDGVPLGEAVREIARRGNANVLFSGDMQAYIATPVTLSFTDVPWRQALESLLKAYKCTILYDADEKIMRVSTLSEADVQFETRSRPLRYVQPEGSHFQAEVVKEDHTEFVSRKGVSQLNVGRSLMEVLDNVRSDTGKITYESRTNTLILRDTPLKIQEMLRVVDEIDVAPQQVLIETRMITVEENPNTNLGVRWGAETATGYEGISGGVSKGPEWTTSWPWAPTSNWGNLGGILGADNPILPSAVVPTLGTMSLTNLNFLVQASQYEDNINLVQAPQILVLDNEEASVFIGNVMTYALLTETVDEGTRSYSFEERELLVGVQLLVIPHVCRGTDQVILEVIPKQTDTPEFAEVSAGENRMQIPANMRVKTVHTKMMLNSTETGVIAGLFRDELTEQMRKVPGLSKIPVVGKLFQHETKRTVKQNTMILVTPTIIPPKHNEAFDRDIEDLRESLASALR